MSRSFKAALAASTALFAQPAFSQDAPYDLGTVIVSGGLTPIEEEKYGRSATVLTGEELKERGIMSVQEALRSVPGVTVSSSGANLTQVRIRGGEANHTLILIDGVEAAGGDSAYYLSGLDTANVERIEVLRGPQSVFYGSNASAGVINIITRKGAVGQEYGLSFEVGSHGSTFASAFASSRNERGGLSLSLSDSRDEGWDFSGDGGERDGTDRWTAILKGDFRVSETVTLGFNLRKSEEHYDSDSTNFAPTSAADYVVDDPTQFSKREEMTFSVFAEHEFMSGRALQRLTYELTDNDDSFSGGAPTNTKTEAYKYRLSFGLDGNAATANHLLNVLLENETDNSSSNPLYDRETNSIAMEYRGSFSNGLDLQAGVRFDDNSVFKDATTWNVAASYSFANGIRLHGSAGTGIVNPSYFELYAAAFGYTGNPNLKPESNEGFDLGVEFPVFEDRGTLDVTYFNEKLENEITAVSTGPGTFTYINQAGTSKRQGLEVEGQFAATESIDLRLSYTYLDAENPNGTVEVRRPEHELGIGVTAQAFRGRGTVSADIRHVAGNMDSQFFPPFGTAKLPDYTLVDFAANYAVTETVDATLRIENVLDENYSDVWGYAGRDRTIYVGFNANW